MFAGLFSSIIEFLFGFGALVLVYQIFLSDWINNRRFAKREKLEAISTADKIAQVKLVSKDDKDIEKFIATNAENLSIEMVTKLVDHIQDIRNDNIINEDNLLKSRIAALVPAEEIEVEPTKRVSRKR